MTNAYVKTIQGLLFFCKVAGIERFTLKPRFLPIRVDAPGGVLRISSDGDDRIGFPTKPQKNPTKGWVLDPEDLKRKNRGL